jgi:predicted lipoprotein with Yx(FWY)xxD motif
MKQLPAKPEHRGLLLGMVAAAALVAACGSAHAGSGVLETAAAANPMTVGTSPTSVGTVLTGPSGRTLYILVSSQGKEVACSGGCRSVWPPVTMGSASPGPGSGVTASLSTAPAGGGTLQLTVSGDPVHYYVGDTSAGLANGEGISSYGGTWYALQPDGRPLTPGMDGNPYGY